MTKRSSLLFKSSAITVTLTLGACALVNTSYAAGPGDFAVLQELNQIKNELMQTNKVYIPSSSTAITDTLAKLYSADDLLFPEIAAKNISSLDGATQTKTLGNKWTQGSISAQLGSISYQLNDAFSSLYRANGWGNQSIKSPLANDIAKLTILSPSFDKLYLPNVICNDGSNPSLCKQPKQSVALQNASNLNFDTFFGPTNYSAGSSDSSSDTINQQTASDNYIKYALSTYDPILSKPNTPTVNTNGAASQNQDFFTKLNNTLKGLSPKAASDTLTNILADPKFEKFWIQLRTYEAQRSLILSNFNFMRAERTPQKDLGKQYGLPTKDASALDVQTAMMNNTVNNPKWYQQMKTAAPSTLQREQLMLSAQLLKTQYNNQMLNERLLATISLLADSTMKQTKTMLTMQEDSLKSLLPNSKKK